MTIVPKRPRPGPVLWRLLYLVLGSILIVALAVPRPASPVAASRAATIATPVAALPTPRPTLAARSVGTPDTGLSHHAAQTQAQATMTPTAAPTELVVSAAPTATGTISTTIASGTDSDGAGAAGPTAQPLSPEEQAAQQAAIRNAQYRMSQSRTLFRLQAIAAAEAQLTAAQATLQRVLAAANQSATAAAAQAAAATKAVPTPTAVPPAPTPSVTAADVAAAQTALQQAQAALQTLKAGPDPAQVATLQAALAAAQQHYNALAQTDSQAKTAAEQQLVAAGDAVRIAQAAYSSAFWQNQQVQGGIDPLTNQHFSGDAAAISATKQRYAALLATATAQLNAAQTKLTQATAARDAAKQQEIHDLATAQAQVDRAQQQLTALGQPPTPATLAAAQAKVDQAQQQLTTVQRAVAAAAAAQLQAQKQQAAAQKNKTLAQVATPTPVPAVIAAQSQVAQAQQQLALARQGAVGRGNWMWPTFGMISSGFGPRDMVVGHFHNGVDIANVQGTPIGAARDGVVIEAGWCAGYGYCVKLSHGGGFESEYGHLASMPPVHVGQVVSVGTIIGLMGTTYDEAGGGFSTGVHLHFTIRSYGVAVDPLRYLP